MHSNYATMQPEVRYAGSKVFLPMQHHNNRTADIVQRGDNETVVPSNTKVTFEASACETLSAAVKHADPVDPVLKSSTY